MSQPSSSALPVILAYSSHQRPHVNNFPGVLLVPTTATHLLLRTGSISLVSTGRDAEGQTPTPCKTPDLLMPNSSSCRTTSHSPGSSHSWESISTVKNYMTLKSSPVDTPALSSLEAEGSRSRISCLPVSTGSLSANQQDFR